MIGRELWSAQEDADEDEEGSATMRDVHVKGSEKTNHGSDND